MKKINAKDIIVPAVSLFVIAVVASALLALTNNITEDLISENLVKTKMKSYQIVFSEATSFSEEKTIQLTGEEFSYVEALDNSGNILGYVFMTAEKGYGGDVTVMTGISADGLVTGVNPLNLSETPGLGMKVQQKDFRDQFKDLTSGISLSKNDVSGNAIKAVTGATITSQAFTDSVNTAFKIFNAVVGGEE